MLLKKRFAKMKEHLYANRRLGKASPRNAARSFFSKKVRPTISKKSKPRLRQAGRIKTLFPESINLSLFINMYPPPHKAARVVCRRWRSAGGRDDDLPFLAADGELLPALKATVFKPEALQFDLRQKPDFRKRVSRSLAIHPHFACLDICCIHVCLFF